MESLKNKIFRYLEDTTIYEDAYGESEVKEAIDKAFKDYENDNSSEHGFSIDLDSKLVEVSDILIEDVRGDFLKWVKNNCTRVIDVLYEYKGQEYLIFVLPELFVKETKSK